MSRYQPRTLVEGRVIEILRADATLSNTGTGLLFPSWAAQIDATDLRVWGSNTRLPESPAIRERLPRVLVSARQLANVSEQEQAGVLIAPVLLTVRSLAPKDQEDLAERIDARVAAVLLSTPLSDARIIATALTDDGGGAKGTIPAFDDAWEVVSQYRSQTVGALLQ